MIASYKSVPSPGKSGNTWANTSLLWTSSIAEKRMYCERVSLWVRWIKSAEDIDIDIDIDETIMPIDSIAMSSLLNIALRVVRLPLPCAFHHFSKT